MIDKISHKKLFLTGASGLLGSNIAYCLKEKYDILGLYHTHPLVLNGVKTVGGDLLDHEALRKTITEFSPEVVIHCAALPDIERCEKDHGLADRLNVTATRNIVDCTPPSVRFIHISTDAIYDGEKKNFSETDPIHPLNYYAITKYRAETEALKRKKLLIVRTSFFGWDIQNKNSLAEWVVEELSNQRRIKGFTDVMTCSIYTFHLARLLDQAVEKDLIGIYNFVCRNAISKYDFTARLAELFGLNSSLIDPISVDEFPFSAKRSKNLTLDTTKLSSSLQRDLPSMEESLQAFFLDFKNGKADSLLNEQFKNLKLQNINP